MLLGHPCNRTMSFINALATSTAEKWWWRPMKWVYLLSWSINTKIKLTMYEVGKPLIKSIFIYSKILSGIGKGRGRPAWDYVECFVISLTNCTVSYIILHFVINFLPIKRTLDPFCYLQDTRMTPSSTIMTFRKYEWVKRTWKPSPNGVWTKVSPRSPSFFLTSQIHP